MHRVITIRRMGHEAAAVLVVCFGTGVLAWLLALTAGRSMGAGWLGELAGESIYSGVIGPFLFLLLDWLMSIRSGRNPFVRQFGRKKNRLR
jgi:hypothetical protein